MNPSAKVVLDLPRRQLFLKYCPDFGCHGTPVPRCLNAQPCIRSGIKTPDRQSRHQPALPYWAATNLGIAARGRPRLAGQNRGFPATMAVTSKQQTGVERVFRL